MSGYQRAGWSVAAPGTDLNINLIRLLISNPLSKGVKQQILHACKLLSHCLYAHNNLFCLIGLSLNILQCSVVSGHQHQILVVDLTVCLNVCIKEVHL